MLDRIGRNITYMRISLTDRCNLRCIYCMPNGIERVPREEILSQNEIERIVRIAAKLGIRSVKLTGGEPLLRRCCIPLIRNLKQIPGIENVTMTTNGVLLQEYLPDLISSGIDAINISLDTIDKKRYEKLSGGGDPQTVIRAVRACAESGIPTKINAVSMRETDPESLLDFARELPVDVRFIEMMPIGYGKEYPGTDNRAIFRKIAENHPDMVKNEARRGNGPAVYYSIPGYPGDVGFISAIHGKFCASCNRIRLTSMGYLKTCLSYQNGVDLKAILRISRTLQETQAPVRSNLSSDTGGKIEAVSEISIVQDPAFDISSETDLLLEKAIRQAILDKPDAHCFDTPEYITEHHLMASIGG